MLNTNNRKIGDRVETLKFISRCEATKRSTEVCLEVGKWRERERKRRWSSFHQCISMRIWNRRIRARHATTRVFTKSILRANRFRKEIDATRYEDVARGVTKLLRYRYLSPPWRYANEASREDGRPCFSCLTHTIPTDDGLGPLLRYTFATPRSDGQAHRESETQ